MIDNLQWLKDETKYNDNDFSMIKFPIKFTKYKSGVFCIHDGGEPVRFAIIPEEWASGNSKKLNWQIHTLQRFG